MEVAIYLGGSIRGSRASRAKGVRSSPCEFSSVKNGDRDKGETMELTTQPQAAQVILVAQFMSSMPYDISGACRVRQKNRTNAIPQTALLYFLENIFDF